MGRKLILAFFIVCWLELPAQEKDTTHAFLFDKAEISFNSGMIMPHSPAIDLVTNQYISSFNINILKTSDGDKLWEKLYHRPDLGIGYYQGSLGNNRIYGNAYSLYGFFEAPLWNIRDKVAFKYRMSTGLSYISKTFNAADNIYNIAIGSHLNLHFNLLINMLINITEQYQITGGLSLTHFSNGKIKSPNKGLNLIHGSAGLRHNFGTSGHPEKEFIRPALNDKNHFSLIWSHGLKDHTRFRDATYYISSLSASYERQYAHVGKAGIGIDGFYNSSLVNYQNKSGNTKLSNLNLYRLGLHLSHDIIAGDFSLTLQLGRYLYNKAFFITEFYNRVGLKYYTKNHLILNLSLKSHNANAEFIEFGIGYLWQ